MKLYSKTKNELYMIDGTVGLASDLSDESMGNTWVLSSIEKRFPGIVRVDVVDLDPSKYCFIIFAGKFSLNQSIKIICPYVILSYSCDFIEPVNNDFIKNALLFTVRDNHTAKTLNIYPNISSDATFLYPHIFRELREKIANIKLIWRNFEDIKKININYDAYIGDVPFSQNKTTYSKIRQIIDKVGFMTYDTLELKYNEKEIIERMKSYDLVISSDYYSLILAMQLGIPCIAFNASPSIKGLMNDCMLKIYCIDVNNMFSLSKILEYAISKNNRVDMMKNISNYTDICKEKIVECMNLVEEKILANVPLLDPNDNVTTTKDPFVLDKISSESKISTYISEVLNKYTTIQQQELLENMKKDFDIFHTSTAAKIKYRLEIAEIRRLERLKEIERKKLEEIEKMEAEKQRVLIADKEKKLAELFDISTVNDATVLRSVLINRKLTEIQNMNK